jgi:hypothetical protein
VKNISACVSVCDSLWPLGGECKHVEDSKHVVCVHRQDLIFLPRCLSLNVPTIMYALVNLVGEDPLGRFSKKAAPSWHLAPSVNGSYHCHH